LKPDKPRLDNKIARVHFCNQMVSLLLTPSVTPLALIISAQGLVRTHPQFARWNLSSNLPKQTLTLRHTLDPKASCTAKVRGLIVELAASPAAAGILKPLISFLVGNGLAGSVVEVADHPKEEAVAAKPKKTARFASNLEAVEAAATAFPGLLIVHDNALKVAADSDFEDPDFTYGALMALADIALRERNYGLKSTRQAHLAKKGLNYASGSSGSTLNKLRKDYTVIHEGERIVIAGHISKGVKARRLLRIYFAWLPESRSFLIGHVGEHLPTETNSH
jgi:hypothetical protein